MTTPSTYQIGYCTSGLQGHKLLDALHLVADLGYRGVFITLDVHHLNPFDADLKLRVQQVKETLEQRSLSVVIETGARFLLDSRRKHHPTLVSRVHSDRNRRIEFLTQALVIARDLSANCISLWSGTAEPSSLHTENWKLLKEGVSELLPFAEVAGVDLAMEPEPGMVVETVADWHRLREELGSPKRLKLSLDCGHPIATGEGAPHEILLAEQDHLAAVAIEDMKRGVHEHLPFGEGDLDLPKLIQALEASSFQGVCAVELGRHSHEGPSQARRSRDFLKTLGVRFA